MSKKLTSFFSSADTNNTSSKDSSVPVTSDESALASHLDDKSSRTLKSSTLVKWINQDLVKMNAFVWLKYKNNEKGEATQMKCSICIQFQKQIQHTFFSDAWIKGTYNLCLSNGFIV